MEPKTTSPIFAKDYEIIKSFKAKHPECPSLADALRVAIEYANAHGVFQ